MASRRSPAASHSINQRRVPMGHVFIRNTLQAPKERSCGTSITSPSLGSAKRDRLSSSTLYGMCQSPFGELYLGGGIARTPQLCCFAACSGFHDIGPAPRNLQLKLHLLASSHSRPPISILLLTVRGCVATARRHSLLCLSHSLITCLPVFQSKKTCLLVFLSK